MDIMRPQPATMYGTVIISIAAATVATKLLDLAFGFAPLIVFAIAISFSTLLGGIRAGLLSLLGTMIAINYFFIPPLHALTLSGDDLVRLGAFAIAVITVVFLRRKQRSSQGNH